MVDNFSKIFIVFRGGENYSKMKIVIAPDSFKGTLTSKEVAELIEKGIRRVFPQAKIVKVPLSDGGEGTVDALIEARGGKVIHKKVTSPLGRKIEAYFGILSDGVTAIIEMAQASGLSLVPKEKRNPLIATTYGTGELIKEALHRRCKKIIIGIGGSATVDGGAGMAQALGVKLLNKRGKEIPLGGGGLGGIVKIEMDELYSMIRNVEVIVASDVNNPLCGEKGAAKIYGPQKGATPEMIEVLDKNLSHFAYMIKKFLNKRVKNIPGSGAAGGLGAGLIAFLGAKLCSGVELMIELSYLKEKIKGADLVISGEGRIDEQTMYGKTPIGVARVAKRENIPAILIGGEIRGDVSGLYKEGVSALMSSIGQVSSLSQVIENSRGSLIKASERAMQLVKVGCFLR